MNRWLETHQGQRAALITLGIMLFACLVKRADKRRVEWLRSCRYVLYPILLLQCEKDFIFLQGGWCVSNACETVS